MVYVAENLSFWLLKDCMSWQVYSKWEGKEGTGVPQGWGGDGYVDPWLALIQGPGNVGDFQREVLNRTPGRLGPKPGVPSLHKEPGTEQQLWLESLDSGGLEKGPVWAKDLRSSEYHTILEELRSPIITALKFPTSLVGQRLKIICKESKFMWHSAGLQWNKTLAHYDICLKTGKCLKDLSTCPLKKEQSS